MRYGLLCLVLVVGCDMGTLSPHIHFQDRRPIHDPPDFYRTIYDNTADCLGVDADFDRVRWFVADEVFWNGRSVRGLWQSPHDITLRHGYTRRLVNIRHEAAHEILQKGVEAHLPDGTMSCE